MTDIEPYNALMLAGDAAEWEDLGLPFALPRSETNYADGIPAELKDSSGPGLETLWGFLLRTEPHTLYLMNNPVGGLIRDERRARRLAKSLNSPFKLRTVTTPELIAAGLREVGVLRAGRAGTGISRQSVNKGPHWLIRGPLSLL